MKTTQQDLLLLPNYFKKIALVLLIISILTAILAASGIVFVADPFFKEITKNFALLSMLILVLSKEKTEDELISRIRLQSFTVAFIYGVVMVFINPYLNLLFGDSFITDQRLSSLMFSMFFFYFFVFYIAKSNG